MCVEIGNNSTTSQVDLLLHVALEAPSVAASYVALPHPDRFPGHQSPQEQHERKNTLLVLQLQHDGCKAHRHFHTPLRPRTIDVRLGDQEQLLLHGLR